MIKKISLGVFYAFLGASFLETLNSTLFKHVDWSIITEDLSFKRIAIIAISGFFIGAFIAGIIEKEDASIELGSKKSCLLDIVRDFDCFCLFDIYFLAICFIFCLLEKESACHY